MSAAHYFAARWSQAQTAEPTPVPATSETDLATLRQRALARMAEVLAGPKPSYQVAGQAMSWNEYLAELRRTVAWCDAQLAAAVEPVEIATRAIS